MTRRQFRARTISGGLWEIVMSRGRTCSRVGSLTPEHVCRIDEMLRSSMSTSMEDASSVDVREDSSVEGSVADVSLPSSGRCRTEKRPSFFDWGCSSEGSDRQEHDALEQEGGPMPVDIAHSSGLTGELRGGRSCARPEHAHGPRENPVRHRCGRHPCRVVRFAHYQPCRHRR